MFSFDFFFGGFAMQQELFLVGLDSFSLFLCLSSSLCLCLSLSLSSYSYSSLSLSLSSLSQLLWKATAILNASKFPCSSSTSFFDGITF